MAEKCDCADGVMIRRLGEKGRLRTPEEFRDKIQEVTEQRISLSTIKRALRNEPLKSTELKLFAGAFGVPEWTVTIPRARSGTNYSWEDIMAGARQVAKEVAFKQPPADAVLSFPGASSIFAGLVLRSVGEPKRFLRIPVYTVTFKRLDESGPFKGYHAVSTGRFKILIPRSLFEGGHTRVIVIDDVILSGVTMETLRRELGEYFSGKDIIFACCICDHNAAVRRTPPQIIGLKKAGIVKDSDFWLPWGKAYANEDAF